MTTLPQPEPDAPAPPPSDQAIRSQVWWQWIWIGGVLSAIGLLVMSTVAPLILRVQNKANLSFSIANAKAALNNKLPNCLDKLNSLFMVWSCRFNKWFRGSRTSI